MSNITNYDDIIDVRDIIARVEELRDQRKSRFVAGFNMPGYMPESGPSEFDNPEDAKRSIIEIIKRAEESTGTEESAELLATFAEDINLEGDEFSVRGPDGLVYWVTEDGTIGLDDDDTEELETLESLLSDLCGNGGDEQWEGYWYPVTLVRDTYFTDYAQELVADIGDLPRGKPSYIEIDWEATARNILMDYSAVEFGGVKYWYR